MSKNLIKRFPIYTTGAQPYTKKLRTSNRKKRMSFSTNHLIAIPLLMLIVLASNILGELIADSYRDYRHRKIEKKLRK